MDCLPCLAFVCLSFISGLLNLTPAAAQVTVPDTTAAGGVTDTGNNSTAPPIATATPATTTIAATATTTTDAPSCPDEPKTKCDGNFILRSTGNSGGACLWSVTTPMDWHEARQHCQSTYAWSDLAVIKNGDKNKLIKAALLHFQGVPSGWIGLSDREKESTYNWNWNVWPMGDTLEKGAFTDWASGFPHKNESANCGMITEDGWEMVECDLKLPFICEHATEVGGGLNYDEMTPTLTVSHYYRGLKNYVLEGTEVTVSCRFLRDRVNPVNKQFMELVGPKEDQVDYDTLHPLTGRFGGQQSSSCVFELTVRTNITVTEAVSDLTILCLSHERRKRECVLFQDDCAKAGPLIMVPKASATQPLMTVKYQRKPDTIFVNSQFSVKCSAVLGTGVRKTLVWSITVDGRPQDEQNSDMHLTVGKENIVTTEMTIELVIDSVNKTHNNLQVGCHVVDVPRPPMMIGGCTLCRQTPVIKVMYGPKPPTLDVSFHEDPDTVHTKKPVVARCEANIGEGGHILWVFVIKGKTTFPQDDPSSSGVDISNTRNVTEDGSTVVTSFLTILEVTKVHEGMILLCLSHKDFPDGATACPQDDLNCAQSNAFLVKEMKLLREVAGPTQMMLILLLGVVSLLAVMTCLSLIHWKMTTETDEPLIDDSERGDDDDADQVAVSQKDLLKDEVRSHLTNVSNRSVKSVGTEVDTVVSGKTIIHEEAGPGGTVILVAETML